MAYVKPKKHLGQHFLTDKNIATRIVESMETDRTTKVIEIGPGTGVLTHLLLSRFKNFEAFDVDRESISYLKEEYAEHAEKFLLMDYLKHSLPDGKVSLIGNFPYNISSQLFFKIWDDRDQVDQVVCMIQKEVADRLCASHGNKTYWILSVLLQAFYQVEFLFKVPPGVFMPPPKVMSAVIRLKRNEVEKLDCDEALFKQVVKAGFGQRRKTLRNALKGLNLSGPKGDEAILSQRAEQLSVQEFVKLTSKLSA